MLIECVPNFSEGRDQAVIDAIVASITEDPNVLLLDQTSDADHNRSVVTFASEPNIVMEAAYRGIAKAAELIDIKQHQGKHPRIGAADVVPFIPLDGATLEDAISIAREVGERVGNELGIPVFLYEAAANRPERQNLADVRRGEYEKLASLDDVQADFGPKQVGSAGAIAIGARMPLIAFNVYLTTDDVTIAKKIARKIRFSNGGLPHIKALGLLVGGRAQVSMNLTDYRVTGLYQVMEAIQQEAQEQEISIHHTELIGLMPQDALMDAAKRYLQLDTFGNRSILENCLQTAQPSDQKDSHE